MTKRLTFLRYILGESTSSMVGQVYSALKQESRKGDFVNLVQADLQEVKINLSDESILSMTKSKWKNMVKRKVIQAGFEQLVYENFTKEKTKYILFEKLEMAKYLQNSRSKSLSKIIFGARSGTLDIKEWNIWKYNDNICEKCKISAETMSHLMTCQAYEGDSHVENWKDIYRNDPDIQYEIALKIRKRLAWTPTLAPKLQMDP